jgi:hypothetical protein
VRFLILAFLLCCGAGVQAARPDVETILRKLGENGSDPVLIARRNAIAHARESRVDYLDEAGQVKKRAVRKYQVSPAGGQPVTKLVSINGKPARDEDERHSKSRETGEKSRSLSLSPELLNRFDFQHGGEETIEGRKMWMLRFSPKEGVDGEGMFERLVGAMSGILWVDAEEHQLAKAEIYLGRKVSFFGGIAGAIDRMDLTFVQRRLEPNLWIGESAFIDFSGRKLFSGIRFRCYETYSEFHKAGEAEAAAPETLSAR